MKPPETPSTQSKTEKRFSVHRRYSYQKVLDNCKRPIRGLWKRNGRFYARMTIEDTNTGTKTKRRIPLLDPDTKKPAATVAEAVKLLHRLRVQREDRTLPVLKRTPKFSEVVDDYLCFHQTVRDAKRETTIAKERSALARWIEHLGETRVDKITRAQINAFIAKRQAQGVSGRTVNLDVIALRNCLKKAMDDGWLKDLPTRGLRPLKWTPRTRELVTAADIDRLCNAAFTPQFHKGRLARSGEAGQPLKNAQQFADYIRLMAYSGARMREALRLKWTDIDFDRKQLTTGADGLAKNREARRVDFNPALEAHLTDMFKRRAPDSQWVFPSPQRGETDRPAKTFVESLRLARAAANMPRFGFHDCRHHFISYAVMSGIDYMTIARWVGHKDGGVLIGKVYGHLSNEHAQAQAARLNFGPTILRQPEAASA